jgi:hypothetical protein
MWRQSPVTFSARFNQDRPRLQSLRLLLPLLFDANSCICELEKFQGLSFSQVAVPFQSKSSPPHAAKMSDRGACAIFGPPGAGRLSALSRYIYGPNLFRALDRTPSLSELFGPIDPSSFQAFSLDEISNCRKEGTTGMNRRESAVCCGPSCVALLGPTAVCPTLTRGKIGRNLSRRPDRCVLKWN